MSKKIEQQPSFSRLTWYASGDMVSGIALGVGLGWWLEQYVTCHPWGIIIGFLLGAAAGFRSVYRMLKRFGYEYVWPKKDN